MRTVAGASPVGPRQISATLLGFLVIYSLIFTTGVIYILRLIGQGPGLASDAGSAADRALGSPLAAVPPEPEG
jgi:cytochrome d ubiquinol oxidase subunit I